MARSVEDMAILTRLVIMIRIYTLYRVGNASLLYGAGNASL